MKKRIIRTGLLAAMMLLLAIGSIWGQRSASVADSGEVAAAQQNEAGAQTAPDIGKIKSCVVDETTKAGTGETESCAAPVMDGASDTMLRITDAMRRILASGSKEFFGGYPVNESFLCWIGGTYGQNMLIRLADNVEREHDAALWYELTGNTMHVLWTDYCKAHGVSSYLWDNVEWKETEDLSCIRIDFIGDIGPESDWKTLEAASDGGKEHLSQSLKDGLQASDVVVASSAPGDLDCEVPYESQPYEVRGFILSGRKLSVVYVSAESEESVLLDAIAAVRAGSDYVVVCVRWGTEGAVYYDKEQEILAVSCVEAGADAVIGGGTHRLQGVTFVNGTPVVYSLGNFCVSTGTLYTAVAQLRIDEEGELSLFMLPCIQKGLSAELLLDEEEKKEFYHYLADVSADVGMDGDGRVHPFHDVSGPGQSPYAYTSGRRYGLHAGDEDLAGRRIDGAGNIQQ